MYTSSSHHYIVGPVHIFMVLSLVSGLYASTELVYYGQNDVSNQTATAYNIGFRMGIINPEKYSLQMFEQHERDIFKDTYRDYISLNATQPISYQEWLIMNNYGILVDTQESILQKKTSARSQLHKGWFVGAVMKGDVLITTKLDTGFIGHVAMMATDQYVIELPGGKRWMMGIEDNNRLLSKDAWFDEYGSGWTTVYRCRDKAVSDSAADWAYRNYYNPSGGTTKTIHTTYRLTFRFHKTNPSYCSKLVLQAFYYSGKPVLKNVFRYGLVIPPIKIPDYFKTPFNMVRVGKF